MTKMDTADTVDTADRAAVPVLACDVDEVVASLVPEWLRRYRDEYGDTLTPEGCTTWNLVDHVHPRCGSRIYDYLNCPDLYDHVLPVPGALDGIQALREDGVRVVFVTSANIHQAGNKLRWLARHGFLTLEHGTISPDYIVAHDKSAIRADAMLDDGPHNLKGFTGKKILFDQPHNRSCGDYPRARGWDEAVQRVREALGFAAPPSSIPLVAFAGVARAGKDESARALTARGYALGAIGDVIKHRAKLGGPAQAARVAAWIQENESGPGVSGVVASALLGWLKIYQEEIDPFTQDDAQKAQIRTYLERLGEAFYDEVLEAYLSTLPSRAVNSRLVRVAEAQAWVAQGGVILEVYRPGREPASDWERDRLAELRASGLVEGTILNGCVGPAGEISLPRDIVPPIFTAGGTIEGLRRIVRYAVFDVIPALRAAGIGPEAGRAAAREERVTDYLKSHPIPAVPDAA